MRLLCVEHKTVWGGGQVALLNVLREWKRTRAAIIPLLVCSPRAELAARARTMQIEMQMFPLGAIEKTRGAGWNFSQRVAPTARLLQTMRRSRTDLVLANGAFSFLASVFAAKLARVPMVWWEHNITLPSDAILKRMIGWADQIVVVSEVIRNQFVELAPNAREKISILYNGVEPERFFEKQETRNEILRARGGNEDVRVVGTVSRLSPEKGMQYFIKAAALIARAREDVNFLIVGDGEERARLETLVKEKGLQDRAQFVGFRDDVENYLQAMDVVLFSSLAEAFPLAVLEAMASARPVVATDVGGVREQILEGITGFLVPPRNVEQMTRAVLNLLDHPDERRAFGERARVRVAEHFTLRQQAETLCAVLEQTVQKRR